MRAIACATGALLFLLLPLLPRTVAAQDALVDRGEPETETEADGTDADQASTDAADQAGQAERSASPPPHTITPRIRIRSDSVMRFQSGYVLTVDETAAPNANRRFWQRVAQLPIYERVSLDARDLADGHVDVHFSAWGALDLTFQTDNGIAAGDFAIGYVEGRHGVASGWGGRRFLSWGIPGGIHLDGGGAALRIADGLVVEAAVGRPVTPRRNELLGQRPDFSEATVAYGARIGYVHPGRLTASLSYLDRWAQGISGDRSVAVDATWRIVPAVDVSGNVSVDVNSVGVEQANLTANIVLGDRVMTDIGWQHVDPTRLLPMWSILAAFASSVFDEIAAGATLRLADNWSVRGAGGVRLYSLDGITTGYRLEALARYVDALSGLRSFISLTRRHDGNDGLNVLHGSVAFPPLWDRLIVALQAAVGVDDLAEKESLLARFSADWPVAGGWNIGASLDWARTPIALSEVRGQLSFSYRPGDAQ
ncbi:MAG: hypothetical protein DRJ42_06190 [Deltaproteobacteria bacterium]|nr:MAG: hypothetical protein DRJ42_06190 [Deltaproteobacteria bacterium]